MKRLKGKHYVEVKDKRYNIHPTEEIISRERKAAKKLRTDYQVNIKTQIGRSQKFFKIKTMN